MSERARGDLSLVGRRLMSNRCRECGAPFYPRVFRRWNNDGTVTARFAPGNRVCHLESDALCAIVDGLSSRIGYPIDRVVVEGQRKATRRLTDANLMPAHGASGILARSRLGSHLAIDIILGVGRTVGHGITSEIAYRHGEYLEVEIRNPYCVPFVIGDAWGAFEAANNVTADAEWEEKPGALVVKLTRTRHGMVWQDPLRFCSTQLPRLPGNIRYERCPRCKLPREVTRNISWDLDSGIVSSRVTGRREATVIVESLQAVLFELESELGDEVPRMVQEILAEYSGSMHRRANGSALPLGYRPFLESLKYKGMGNPVKWESSGGILDVRIDNPFSGVILAGMLQGVYRRVEGVEGDSRWNISPDGFMKAVLFPA